MMTMLCYTAKSLPICVYCASDVLVVLNDKYLQCFDCNDMHTYNLSYCALYKNFSFDLQYVAKKYVKAL